MRFANRFFTLLIFLFPAVSAYAQFSNKENPNGNPNYSKLLIERQISESSSVEDPEKRIKILRRAAEFLWEIENENSRKYFSEAFQNAENLHKEKGFQIPTKIIKRRNFGF